MTDNNDIASDVAAAPASRAWPRRYTLVALSFGALFICYMDRVNVSIAIIPMAEDLGWGAERQGAVLSSFFVGYLLTQIIGGRLADRYGGKAVLGIGVIAWSAFTFVTPPAAGAGIALLLMVRIGMGIGEGVTLPAIYSLYGRWLPTREKSRAIGFTLSAIPLATVFTLLVAPWITLRIGWEWIFYIFGAAGLLWYLAWHPLVSSDPRQHTGVSAAELATIRTDAAEADNAAPPPWREMLKSPPVWAIIVSHFCGNWGMYILIAWLPTYVTSGLGVDFARAGVYSMFPWIASFLFLNIAGYLADRLIAAGRPVGAVRKLMQTIGFGGSAVVMFFVGFIEGAPAAIACMTLGMALYAFGTAGFGVNHLDIAPRHAGVLMGLSNTAGTLPGVMGVYITGMILEATGSWLLVFQLAAAVYFVGMVFFLLFAKSERLFE